MLNLHLKHFIFGIKKKLQKNKKKNTIRCIFYAEFDFFWLRQENDQVTHQITDQM